MFQDIFKLLDSFGLEYTQDGDNIFMRCPIHEGSDNPHGLSISLDKQMWRCWTRGCHEHYKSDVFGFVKGLLDTDNFGKALKYICEVYNVNGAKKDGNSNVDRGGGSIDSEFSNLVRQVKGSRRTSGGKCELEYVARPKTDSIPSPYFISRGFREETLKFFGVRDASDKRGFLRHRVIIPIWDADGVYCGYIGRATLPYIEPKYIFSKGIRKSDYLYNYHNALAGLADVGVDTLFLVEGQGDVWRLWECGVKNVVGLFGKDISKKQKELLLTSGATKLVILTDNDQAGRESKIKIKRKLGRLFKLVFPKMHTKDLGSMMCKQIDENILQDLRGYY